MATKKAASSKESTPAKSKKQELTVSEKKAIKTFFDAVKKFIQVYDENKDYTYNTAKSPLSKSAEQRRKEYEYLKNGVDMLLGKKSDAEIAQIAKAIQLADAYKLIHFVRRKA